MALGPVIAKRSLLQTAAAVSLSALLPLASAGHRSDPENGRQGASAAPGSDREVRSLRTVNRSENGPGATNSLFPGAVVAAHFKDRFPALSIISRSGEQISISRSGVSVKLPSSGGITPEQVVDELHRLFGLRGYAIGRADLGDAAYLRSIAQQAHAAGDLPPSTAADSAVYALDGRAITALHERAMNTEPNQWKLRFAFAALDKFLRDTDGRKSPVPSGQPCIELAALLNEIGETAAVRTGRSFEALRPHFESAVRSRGGNPESGVTRANVERLFKDYTTKRSKLWHAALPAGQR